MTHRALLTILAATAALALPSVAAADVTYDVDAFTLLKGTAAGSDGDGWTSSSSFETEIDQQIHGIAAAGDAEVIQATAPANRLAVNALTQNYALATAMGTISWSCVPDGVPTGAPGSIKLTRSGDLGFAELVVAQSVDQARNCTGYSSFATTINITPRPVLAVWTFAWADLAKPGGISHTIDSSVQPCGEWTIFQTDCRLQFGGSVSIRRVAAAPLPDPEPKPRPTPATNDDDDPTSPPRPATPIKAVKGTLTKDGTAAKVKLTCTSACAGKISATAIAKERMKARGVGTRSYANPSGGTKTIKVQFIRGGGRTVRKHGAVIINVTSGAQSRSVRVSAR